MALLTVIGKRLAKSGVVFTYLGPLSDCKECKVKTICFHLEQGRRYRIVGARDIVHDCPVHDDGVLVVEVESLPLDIVIPRKQALEGSTVTVELPKCRRWFCPNYRLCFPHGVVNGMKGNVLKVGGGVDCPAGHERARVVLD